MTLDVPTIMAIDPSDHLGLHVMDIIVAIASYEHIITPPQHPNTSLIPPKNHTEIN